MSATTRAEQVAILCDRQGSDERRMAAARSLGAHAGSDALDSLYAAAADTRDDPRVLHAVGEAIALILLRLDQVHAAPLWDFAGPAYLGFDATVASAQQHTPPS
jgi:hypothetical protein